jgi:glutamate--cysteine ligase
MNEAKLSAAQQTFSKADMIAWLADHATAPEDWRIGTEHEKFLFRSADHRPVSYEGADGIGALLQRLLDQQEFQPILEQGTLIGLKDNHGGSITLEPGGQLELSGAPLENLHQSCAETGRHLKQMRAVTEALGLGMIGLGFQPEWRREDITWMPKGRYRIMREYMPKKGDLGLDMMLRTCTVQVNLDYADEADMRRKFRTALALQPVASALFANSPFIEGKPSGWKSARVRVWTDTDPDRCGVPACVFDPGFGYEAWVDYLLSVPMYFLHRGDAYIDVAGQSFADFLQGELPGHPGERPLLTDFEDHITTAFPEVRLKGYLEMRGADSGLWENICALPAFWVGLLYDETALEDAAALAAPLTANDVEAGRISAARDGLQGQLGGYAMHRLAEQLVTIAEGGLQRRARTNSSGQDETIFLAPLQQIVKSGETRADMLLRLYHGAWAEDISQLYSRFNY